MNEGLDVSSMKLLLVHYLFFLMYPPKSSLKFLLLKEVDDSFNMKYFELKHSTTIRQTLVRMAYAMMYNSFLLLLFNASK